MRVAIDATPLTLSSGGLRRYTQELSVALAESFPQDEFFLVSDQRFGMPHTAPINLRRGGGAGPPGRAPLVALGLGPRTASAGSRIVPRHGFRGTLLTAPSKRLDAARPLPVDGCGLAFQRRQGSPTDTPADRIGLGHYDRDPQRGGAEAGHRAVPDSSGPHPRGPARRLRLFPPA